MLECSAAQRAPGVPRLTQTSSSDIILEWYISWITSRKHAWMPLHRISRTRDDALVYCTLPSEARLGCAKLTGLHRDQRCRSTVALKHQGLMRMCQSKCRSWPSPACTDRLHLTPLTGQCPWQHSTGAEQPWGCQPNPKSILPGPNLVHASKPALWFLSAATAPLYSEIYHYAGQTNPLPDPTNHRHVLARLGKQYNLMVKINCREWLKLSKQDHL